MANRTLTIISPLLVLLLLVLPVAEAGCSTQSGNLFVPVLTEGPPPFSNPSLMQGVTVWKIGASGHTNDGFVLSAVAGSSTVRTCPLAQCVEFPDFNVAWYASGDNYITHYDNPGTDVGKVPQNAEYALVYMRYGPDPGNGDGPFPWSTGASFDLYLGC